MTKQIEENLNKLRFLRCTHPDEWKIAQNFRQKYFFDKVSMADPYTWTFDHPEHIHFVLYLDSVIIGYAHLQLWPQSRAAMRIIVIDELYRQQGYGEAFLKLCEQWLREQEYQVIHTESSPSALSFYQKLGYTDMPFDDPDGYESDPHDTPLGKIL